MKEKFLNNQVKKQNSIFKSYFSNFEEQQYKYN